MIILYLKGEKDLNLVLDLLLSNRYKYAHTHGRALIHLQQYNHMHARMHACTHAQTHTHCTFVLLT